MITGEKITLRPVEKTDITIFRQWRNDLEIKQNAILHPFPITAEMEESWYQKIANDTSNKTIFFTIVENQSNKVIGFTQFLNINWVNRNAYFGIIIGDKSTQRKGYGKETTKLMIDYGFKILNFHKILLEVVSNNLAAIKLYEDIGFKQEGILKEDVFINNKYHDVLILSLFKKYLF